MRRIILIASLILLIIIGIGVSIYVYNSGKCSIKVSSSGNLPLTIKISDKNEWARYTKALATCNNGTYKVYDLAGLRDNKAIEVKKITFVFTNDQTDLISFRNSNTNEVYFRWKIELNSAAKTAQVYLHVPNQEREKLEKYTFSAIHAISLMLFNIDNTSIKNTNLVNYSSFQQLGLEYEKK
ncbi:MAG: hypothetical protein A2427_00510 [Candidatus Nealsonbacteria bacterium RIFOXYC1_FULL_40_7]|uniref:Uncharacterized protein n=1 Tax=Candidatus Nealsonbacteria bacterium RIFOXYC1_FULL_40_7 TaxID=1801678 RepID=A0A1G2ERR3_9BACT|nr:MAG: hypothetical protein A2427_00510 [Candidatus Nealsonbacteria bacterium RIFOXYC1_FULL_40_7]